MRALLDDGYRSALALAGDLRAELDALEAEDLDALRAAAAAKRAQLEALEAVEARRMALLAERGLGDDTDGMQALLGDDDGLARQWRRYLKVADDCQRANLTNGAVIRLRQQQVTSALAVLAGGETGIYGPGGTERPAASRTLAEA